MRTKKFYIGFMILGLASAIPAQAQSPEDLLKGLVLRGVNEAIRNSNETEPPRPSTQQAAPAPGKTVPREVVQPSLLIRDIQAALAARGFDPGLSDGLMGRRTRAAIIAFENTTGAPQSGQPTQALLDQILKTKAESPTTLHANAGDFTPQTRLWLSYYDFAISEEEKRNDALRYVTKVFNQANGKPNVGAFKDDTGQFTRSELQGRDLSFVQNEADLDALIAYITGFKATEPVAVTIVEDWQPTRYDFDNGTLILAAGTNSVVGGATNRLFRSDVPDAMVPQSDDSYFQLLAYANIGRTIFPFAVQFDRTLPNLSRNGLPLDAQEAERLLVNQGRLTARLDMVVDPTSFHMADNGVTANANVTRLWLETADGQLLLDLAGAEMPKVEPEQPPVQETATPAVIETPPPPADPVAEVSQAQTVPTVPFTPRKSEGESVYLIYTPETRNRTQPITVQMTCLDQPEENYLGAVEQVLGTDGKPRLYAQVFPEDETDAYIKQISTPEHMAFVGVGDCAYRILKSARARYGSQVQLVTLVEGTRGNNVLTLLQPSDKQDLAPYQRLLLTNANDAMDDARLKSIVASYLTRYKRRPEEETSGLFDADNLVEKDPNFLAARELTNVRAQIERAALTAPVRFGYTITAKITDYDFDKQEIVLRGDTLFKLRRDGSFEIRADNFVPLENNLIRHILAKGGDWVTPGLFSDRVLSMPRIPADPALAEQLMSGRQNIALYLEFEAGTPTLTGKNGNIGVPLSLLRVVPTSSNGHRFDPIPAEAFALVEVANVETAIPPEKEKAASPAPSSAPATTDTPVSEGDTLMRTKVEYDLLGIRLTDSTAEALGKLAEHGKIVYQAAWQGRDPDLVGATLTLVVLVLENGTTEYWNLTHIGGDFDHFAAISRSFAVPGTVPFATLVSSFHDKYGKDDTGADMMEPVMFWGTGDAPECRKTLFIKSHPARGTLVASQGRINDIPEFRNAGTLPPEAIVSMSASFSIPKDSSACGDIVIADIAPAAGAGVTEHGIGIFLAATDKLVEPPQPAGAPEPGFKL
ncbi:peptidoglycan-binding domain-containing protein [Pseudosulfitobacter pseudonitzschiae]|uniref:peptidoglycan-binding domain-containing protein n=1 Tax=Pseudosulfitobacter pseudonitzschiae TaxID=1402135 RepID=UPI001AF3F1F2|nr:peptidoglycan-binding domain-containing protein [Pseudosulfitobacter pseudonitzschiae]MBM1816659.1 hypothetical protein [Pseudosulfitobacter pseudonitzschiae]MBM1833257.1 hypothetical protein [Pseudosulfitobacter pseudonitzschiae]MBM1838125.1 hypothetical protein [Pseudosulfitobacter pseudonitzschiae]MBM1843386.1 hypothetical protein [Pseudosulfitobacter pseudonitzschiae]MBM1848252.1 hypothetical protein [Pseudosulfitobacter pseudonitzschiae]